MKENQIMDIRTSCLGVLALHDASGYQIRKMFEEGPFSVFAEGSFGSIYPALKSLEKELLIERYDIENETGPQKKMYKITDEGRRVLYQSLSLEPRPDKYKSDFLFSIYFAQELNPAFVNQIIEERLLFLADKITHLEKKCAQEQDYAAGQQFVHEFGLCLNKAAFNFLEQHKESLCEKLTHPLPSDPLKISAAE